MNEVPRLLLLVVASYHTFVTGKHFCAVLASAQTRLVLGEGATYVRTQSNLRYALIHHHARSRRGGIVTRVNTFTLVLS